MKYPYWNEYDNAKKWKAVAAELSLETNNATTKADLTNMVKFLGQEAARLQAEVYKAEAEVERLQTDMIDYIRGATYMTKQIQDRDEELTLLRKVADLVRTMQEPESGYSARLAEIEMLKVLDEYQTWKEGQDGKSI
jgi:hypothetical protein